MKLAEAKALLDNAAKDLIQDCPHCGARAHIEALWNANHVLRNRNVEFYFVFRCKPCKKLVLKTFLAEQNPYSEDELLTLKGWTDMFPVDMDDQLAREEKEFIPTEVLQDYQEALKCQSIGANRASCAMYRRSLQSALIRKGADPALDLVKQIESISALPSDVKDWAHQIRIFGNWGSHPDVDNLKDVDASDVADVHDFMSKLLLYIFIMPEKVRASREKRERKSNVKVDGKAPSK